MYFKIIYCEIIKVFRLKPFYIDNIIYYTLSEASKKLNINYLTIRNRLISNKFTNYIYIEDIDLISKLNDEYLKQDSIEQFLN